MSLHSIHTRSRLVIWLYAGLAWAPGGVWAQGEPGRGACVEPATGCVPFFELESGGAGASGLPAPCECPASGPWLVGASTSGRVIEPRVPVDGICTQPATESQPSCGDGAVGEVPWLLDDGDGLERLGGPTRIMAVADRSHGDSAPAIAVRTACGTWLGGQEQACQSGWDGRAWEWEADQVSAVFDLPLGTRRAAIAVSGFPPARSPVQIYADNAVGSADPECIKTLYWDGRDRGGRMRCTKRLHLPGDQSGFVVKTPDTERRPLPAGGWADNLLCVDNGVYARSNEVPWDKLEGGVEGVLLPMGGRAEEYTGLTEVHSDRGATKWTLSDEPGDWWSTVIPPALTQPESGVIDLSIIVEPGRHVGRDGCAALDVQLSAEVACVAEEGNTGVRIGVDSLSIFDNPACPFSPETGRLRCESARHFGTGCRSDALDVGVGLPRRTLMFRGLAPAACSARGGDLVVHVGVIRARYPEGTYTGRACGPCAQVMASGDHDDRHDECLAYRLRTVVNPWPPEVAR